MRSRMRRPTEGIIIPLLDRTVVRPDRIDKRPCVMYAGSGVLQRQERRPAEHIRIDPAEYCLQSFGF